MKENQQREFKLYGYIILLATSIFDGTPIYFYLIDTSTFFAVCLVGLNGMP